MNTVVIGAGIVGASTAYHLSKLGHNVTLIDRHDKGKATEAGAGIICPWLSQRRNKAWYQLARAGARFYPELVKDLASKGEQDIGYANVGVLSVHTDENKLDQMMERALKRQNEAPEMGEVTKLSPQQTKERFPLLADGLSAIHVSGGARVNGKSLCHALIKAAKSNGVHYIHGDATISVTGDRVDGAYVNGELLRADKIVISAGAWAKQLLAPIGIDLQVEPQKAQIIHLKLEDGVECDKWPVIMTSTSKYLLGFEGERLVVGSTHENDCGYNTSATVGGLHELLDVACAIAPEVKNSELLETRVGFRPVTPNFLPVLGEISTCRGLFAVNGLGSTGLTVGPYVGSQLANLIVGHEVELDLSLYDINQVIGEK